MNRKNDNLKQIQTEVNEGLGRNDADDSEARDRAQLME